MFKLTGKWNTGDRKSQLSSIRSSNSPNLSLLGVYPLDLRSQLAMDQA